MFVCDANVITTGNMNEKAHTFLPPVSNESSEIIRMFNEEFNEHIDEDKKSLNYYPENLRSEIDSINEWVYDTVNNGVYKSGFATTQAACKYVDQR
jgi:glutathionyl-hydroquinone reductase